MIGDQIFDSDQKNLKLPLKIANSSSNWMNGFEIGDMVWGKVKSHPWWPGHIFDEAFATSSVQKSKKEKHVLVAFFGDSSYGWFDPAELIPFEPNYAEKSRQNTSKNFLKAVEEAVDEAGRRVSLGVSCRCFNPLRIRASSVEGYFSVDVEGYENGGIYSLKRIVEARDGFLPRTAVDFLRFAAESPREFAGVWGFEGVRQRAVLLAIRRAMFENSDRVKAVLDDGGEEMGRVQARAAPLSGPMVIAEPLTEREATEPLTQPETTEPAEPLTEREKTEPAPGTATAATVPPVKAKRSKTSSKRRKDLMTLAGNASIDFAVQHRTSHEAQTPTPVVEKETAASSVAPARPLPVNGGGGDETLKKLKKKRKRDPGLGPPALAPKKALRDLPAATVPSPLPDLAAADVDLSVALSELTALAVDPLRPPSAVSPVFLLFRSLIFEKGLPVPPPKEYESVLLRRTSELTKPRRPAPPPSRADDPTKAGRKRAISSDRPDDMAPKKPKKPEKPPAKLPIKHPKQEPPPPPPPKKTEVSPPKPKVEEPTFLVMKFPQRSTLPSVSSLKARFARFGPLDLSGTRVFWKSYTCKVLFKYKTDAEAALAYAQTNDVFGQIRVLYALRDPDQLSDLPPPPKPLDSGPPPKPPKSILKKPSEEGAAPVVPKETQRVKFLVPSVPADVDFSKKPSGDSVATVVPKEIPRVKFLVPADPPPPHRPSADVDFSKKPSEGGIVPKESQRVKFLVPADPQPPRRPSADVDLLKKPSEDGVIPKETRQIKFPIPADLQPPRRPSGDVDFSRQMLSLLTRCRDIVADVKSALGYVPYHPL